MTSAEGRASGAAVWTALVTVYIVWGSTYLAIRVVVEERPRAVTWLGVLVGFGGIAAISLPRGGIDDVEPWGVLLILLATLSWALGSFLSPRLGLPRGALLATAYEMLMGGVIMTAVALVAGEVNGFTPGEVPARGWLALGYLIVVGSLLGYTAYVFALANAPLSLVGTYAYVNPVVAVFLGHPGARTTSEGRVTSASNGAADPGVRAHRPDHRADRGRGCHPHRA